MVKIINQYNNSNLKKILINQFLVKNYLLLSQKKNKNFAALILLQVKLTLINKLTIYQKICFIVKSQA